MASRTAIGPSNTLVPTPAVDDLKFLLMFNKKFFCLLIHLKIYIFDLNIILIINDFFFTLELIFSAYSSVKFFFWKSES